MLEEYSKPAINRSLTIYCACAYALLILYSTQPLRSEHILVKAEGKFVVGDSALRSYIELPEYSHDAFLTMEASISKMEAHNALIKLCKEQYSISKRADSSQNFVQYKWGSEIVKLQWLQQQLVAVLSIHNTRVKNQKSKEI